MAKYSEISMATAYRDAESAKKMFKNYRTFDFEFWRTWILNNIVEHIRKLQEMDDLNSQKVIAMQYNNIITLLGERPKEKDPKREEPHNFSIPISLSGEPLKGDPDEWEKIPPINVKKFSRMLSKYFSKKN